MPRRKNGRGTLHIIGGLLVASAMVRGIATGTPVVAQDQLSQEPVVTQTEAATSAPDALLAALQDREKRLIARENQVADRIQAIRLAETEIAEQLTALQDAETALRETLALAETAASDDLARLATVYENMKPRDAANLFAEMTPNFAAGFLGLMDPTSAAAIMTELEPAVAHTFSVMLAGRNADVPTE
ncbi:MotE family protein [Yoonia sp. 208BN28-4]|uniref:MotE family protein n=1 Tax=Yoonia sp. 208BN28-4 TaxID=3126505 RepID=UPI0030ECE260